MSRVLAIADGAIGALLAVMTAAVALRTELGDPTPAALLGYIGFLGMNGYAAVRLLTWRIGGER